MNERPPDFERRLEELKAEALRHGKVAGVPGYFGLPMLKKPVWTWEIPVYFFIGGMSGMSAVIALASFFSGDLRLCRAAMWLAAAGAMVSPILLTLDLGRPRLFLNMLRIFKPQSPMSVGAWVLTFFGALAVPGALLTEWHWHQLMQGGEGLPGILLLAVAGLTAFFGAVLATYTGVLLAVTAIPAWNSHRILLPVHFGSAALGSAAAALQLGGFSLASLRAISLGMAVVETVLAALLFLRRNPRTDGPLHLGRSGALLLAAEILTGPIALVLFLSLPPAFGSLAFMAGSLISRLGWVAVGRASAADVRATV